MTAELSALMRPQLCFAPSRNVQTPVTSSPAAVPMLMVAVEPDTLAVMAGADGLTGAVGGGVTVPGVIDPAAAVIVDFAPDVDAALAICEKLRDNSKKSFIVVTEASAQMQALESGARYVLLKPVPAQVLLDRTAQLRGN